MTTRTRRSITYLTAEVHDRIIAHMRTGSNFAEAVRRAGLNMSTPYRWLQLARRGEGTAEEVRLLAAVMAEEERQRAAIAARPALDAPRKSHVSRTDSLEARIARLERLVGDAA